MYHDIITDDQDIIGTVEIFKFDGVRVCEGDCWADEDGETLPAGWYWWTCVPGCLPDSDPFGPFATKTKAMDDAERSYLD
jgi:hypothetical protein